MTLPRQQMTDTEAGKTSYIAMLGVAYAVMMAVTAARESGRTYSCSTLPRQPWSCQIFTSA